VCDIRNFILPLQWKKSNKIILYMDNTMKQVKLHSKSRMSGDRLVKNVPWLNLSGLWLESAGFNVGQRIEIAIADKQLTIKAL
jgi:toxic protein SymE